MAGAAKDAPGAMGEGGIIKSRDDMFARGG